MSSDHAGKVAELGLDERIRRLQADFDSSFSRDVEEERLDLALHLVVRIDQEYFALPIQHVGRLVRDAEVMPLPGAPSHLMGIMNLRGVLTTVYDLPTMFGGSVRRSSQHNVVVMKGLAFDGAIAVSEIGQLVALDVDLVGTPPRTLPAALRHVIRGTVYHDDMFFLFLDLDQLFVQLDARG